MEINIKQRIIKMIESFKKQLTENGFVFEEITDELISVENFLSQEEINGFWEIINNTSQADWEVEYMGNLKTFCMEKFGRDDVDNLVAEGKFEITQNWVDKNFNILNYEIYKPMYKRLNSMVIKSFDSLFVSGLATIQRMQKGVELKSHTDQHTDPSIRYASIIYINDDYVDGTLFFPKLGIELKPKPGTLLFFPGNEEYEHGVKHVGEGPIRYVVVGFIKERDYYEKNKY
jgi:hypothetical protein